MKKIAFYLAGMLVAALFASEASAIPAFARQTGMACNACHWQTYPALTSFGRAFKASGYTMMGAQAKVEGENGLSIPSVLNGAFYTQLRYIKTNGPVVGGPATNNGRYDMPDEMALFFGGRGSENIGYLLEVALVGNNGVSGVTFANVKMPFMFDVGRVKMGAIPFTSSGVGASYGLDMFATGSTGAGRINENGMGYSAALYMGASNNAGTSASDATGVAFVAANENFHINVTPYAGAFAGVTTTTKLGATYVRAAWTPSINGWDYGVGVQNWSGKPGKGSGVLATQDNEARLTIIDAQAQGEVSGMPLGIYASYGRAPTSSAVVTATGGGSNIYNLCLSGGVGAAACQDRTAFGMMGDLWVMPGTLGVQLGFMRAKTGVVNQTTLAQEKDDSWTIGARYKVRQNVKLGLAYTKFSGNAYDTGGSGGANAANYAAGGAVGVAGAAPARGDSRTTFILSGGF